MLTHQLSLVSIDAKKKEFINPKNNDEQCFKWTVIAALHHEDIKYHPERIGMLHQ